MAETLFTRFEGAPRVLSALIVVAVLQVGCDGQPDQPTPTPTPTPVPTALAVSSVAPNTTISGAPVSISGSGFRAGVTVSFGGVKAEVSGVLPSSIVTRVPELAPGRVDIVVTNTNGESATLAGAFTLVPFAVTAYYPEKGYGEYLFTLWGTGLIEGTVVKYGGVAPRIAFAAYPGMVGLLPPHDPGPVDITVTSPYGKTLTIPNGLSYVSQPVLRASPDTVSVGGSVTVSWVVEVTPSDDFITVHPLGFQLPAGPTLQSFLVPGNSGSMTFTFPSWFPPGVYEFRYEPAEGQWGAMAARSNAVTVTPSAASPAAAVRIPVLPLNPLFSHQRNTDVRRE